MQLSDFLSEKLILLELEADDKVEAFRTMIARMASNNAISCPERFLEEVIARETIEPTCIGRGVAFPHSRTLCVKRPVIAFGRAQHSIPFNSDEEDNVQLIFVMGTPKDDANIYLQILARLCRLLRQSNFRERLLSAATPTEIVNLFKEYEAPSVEQSLSLN